MTDELAIEVRDLRMSYAWRGRLGVVLQESSLEAELTVHELLELYAGYHTRPLPVGEILELAGWPTWPPAAAGGSRAGSSAGSTSCWR